MTTNAYQSLQSLPREQLEDYAIRAALRIRMDRQDMSAGDYFVAVITGFMLGALVAASGFLAGASLG